ncbi:unnamed protein product [Gongylonema pulchrum]|uniref:Uncharacterized protein n=1 Tax=Gongylonema pulchrum TaxID=637853 RepID=A0A183EPQ2_9BILA|nr:unnamed protein product [Gongylonema pulchrum]
MDKPLWANEDVTPRQWRIESAEQLGCVVRHLAELLIGAIPALALRWTQLAMAMALSTSNRHIAGRSFQITSALCQSPSPWIPNVLSRLAETVGEPHEETQAYVTDIMLCLQTTVSHLAPVSRPAHAQSPTHARSTSYTPALLRQTAIAAASAAISPTHERKISISPSPWIPNVLSRLAETVGEPHEETQAYVTDIMLCLQTTVSHLAPVSRPAHAQSPTHAQNPY